MQSKTKTPCVFNMCGMKIVALLKFESLHRVLGPYKDFTLKRLVLSSGLQAHYKGLLAGVCGQL